MKTFKFALTLMAACLMAYSPVTFASMSAQEKSSFNQYMKENFKGTYSQAFQRHGGFFTPGSRALYETWLKNFGHQNLPHPQAMVTKDKNGRDSVKLILNQNGQTLTLTFFEGNYETFNANGRSIAFAEARDIPTFARELAKADSRFVAFAKEAQSAAVPEKLLRMDQFEKMPALKRVEYMMLVRQSAEAAQKVIEADAKKKHAENSPSSASMFALSAILGLEEAWAVPTAGQTCIVAGNISVYENPGPKCAPFPKSTKDFIPQPTFHHLCPNNGGQTMIACNPLLYGAEANGQPICLDSSSQPDFTDKATAMCNDKSRLEGQPGSRERIASYQRILQSYQNLKNGKDVKDCFAEDHTIHTKCADVFQPQLNEFESFLKQADDVCKKVELGDQKTACEELRKRNLELYGFIPGPHHYKNVDLVKAGCEATHGTEWIGTEVGQEMCICTSTGQEAKDLGGNRFECPAIAQTSPKEDKDECKKEDGSKKHTFKCDPVPWLIGGAAVALLGWLLFRHSGDSPASGTPILVTTPTTGGGGSITPTTTMIIIPTTTMAPAHEGGTGTTLPNAGGVRGTQ